MNSVVFFIAGAICIAIYIYTIYRKGARANRLIEHKVIFDEERGDWVVDDTYGFGTLAEVEQFLDTLDN